MQFDAVEREFLILSNQLVRLSQSFRALAVELRRERGYGNQLVADSRRESSDDQTTPQNQIGAPIQEPLSFQKDWSEDDEVHAK